jgi:hypothetical protein
VRATIDIDDLDGQHSAHSATTTTTAAHGTTTTPVVQAPRRPTSQARESLGCIAQPTAGSDTPTRHLAPGIAVGQGALMPPWLWYC